jgi:hypothetical protein
LLAPFFEPALTVPAAANPGSFRAGGTLQIPALDQEAETGLSRNRTPMLQGLWPSPPALYLFNAAKIMSEKSPIIFIMDKNT